MRIILLQNQAAGRGNAGAGLGQLVDRLRQASHDVAVLAVGPGVDHSGHAAVIAGADLLLIAGGDGTLHHILPTAVASRVPVYQIPFGTENLFARQFGMDRSPERLLAAIARKNVLQVDLLDCNGRLAALMGSVGFDACVVERVAAARTATVTRLAYVAQGLIELRQPRFPTLSVEVDGRALIQSQPGLVVVANSRQYAARLDPARSASMTDGLLDVVFYPHRSRVRLGAWGLRTALGVHTRSRSLITAQGKRVHIRCAGQAAPFQLDGECAGRLLAEEPDGDRDQTELRFEVRPGALRVLMPVN